MNSDGNVRTSWKVFVHVVTWNSAAHVCRCIESVLTQEGFTLGEGLHVHVTDNASTDATEHLVGRFLRKGITFSRNTENLGFCAAHNQGVHRAVIGGYETILVLNPDVALSTNTLLAMVRGLEIDPTVGSVTPKLLRADSELSPIEPRTIDAAGMVLYPSLRHFDRGSGARDIGQFEESAYVFGGTGACLLISTACAWSLALPYAATSDAVDQLYPQLSRSSLPRVQLFDEAFFAYREDADLAWRMRRLGWRCRYMPSAVAFHVRVVVPERREQLPAALNRYSVRNRFLLQLNNWTIACGLKSFVLGVIIRNVLVIGGVISRERTSLPALREVLLLVPRALRNRRTARTRVREVLGRIPAKSLNELNEGVSVRQSDAQVRRNGTNQSSLTDTQVSEFMQDRAK